MSLSTLLSAPVFSRVVIAKVAIDLLLSVISFSKSTLQLITAFGCLTDTCKHCHSLVQREENACLVECFDCSEAEGGLGRGAEELQHRNGRGQFGGSRRLQVDEGRGRLEYDHFTLVAQTGVDESEQGGVRSENEHSTQLKKNARKLTAHPHPAIWQRF